MRVVIFGASGIIGTHLRLCVPVGVEPIWMRRHADPLHCGLDLLDFDALNVFLSSEKPDVVINLAGESRTDEVERDPVVAYPVNVDVPARLAMWAMRCGSHYVHVSTQAVFSGSHPPYHAKSARLAVNEYGRQKILAEQAVEKAGSQYTIVRPTFVLGVRPAPAIGRPNPIEQMLTQETQRQVADRWFSVSFAADVAAEIWKIALGDPVVGAVHVGIPHGVSRYDLARFAEPGIDLDDLGGLVPAEIMSRVTRARHQDFPGLAPRPLDTTYADKDGRSTRENSEVAAAASSVPDLQRAWKSAGLIKSGIDQCRTDLAARNAMGVTQRAKELALFTGLSESACLAKLNTGFHALHAEVASDFRAAVRIPCGECNGTGAVHGDHNCPACVGLGKSVRERRAPETDGELLDWYRSTLAYCLELSCYHCDAGVPPPGWNYAGMCRGIADRLEAAGAKRVLCLGDGIGDLTLSLAQRGFDAVYHDLAGSRTAAFARVRLLMYTGIDFMDTDPVAHGRRSHLTGGWEPCLGTDCYDAIASMDYLEHCVNVEIWVKAIHAALRPGGLFCAQNAFAAGSGPDGSIPCHLAINDHFEKDWDPLCTSVGFRQLSSNWYVKPE